MDQINNDEIKSTVTKNVHETYEAQGVTLAQIIHILRKKAWITILCVILAVGAAVFYLNWVTPVYESSSTVLIEPIANASSIEGLIEDGSRRNSNISTEVELVGSKTTLKNALNMLDLGKYSDKDGISYDLKQQNHEKIGGKVTIKAINNTKLVSISVQDQNPVFAADYANALAKSSTDLLCGIARNSKSAQRQFIEDQIPVTEQLLSEATEKLARYREESGVVQMSEKSIKLSKLISDFQLRREPLEFQRVAAQATLDSYAQILEISDEKTEGFKKNEQVADAIESFKTNEMELCMYESTEDSGSSNRKYVLENGAEFGSKAIYKAVIAAVSPQNDIERLYAKSLSDVLEVSAMLDVLTAVENQYSAELSQYPVLERELLENERNVQLYESLVLSLRQMLEETKMVEAAVVGNITVIDAAQTPSSPISPRKVVVMLASVIAGVAVGVALSIMIVFADDSVTDEEQIVNIFGPDVPSIGWTPYIKNIHSVDVSVPGLIVYNDPDGYIAERFKSISNNIVFALGKAKKVVSINSTDMNAGKTTIACNVAASYAMVGKKVLIIDGDFRKPAVEAFFGLKKSAIGLTDVVMKGVDYTACLIRPVEKIPSLHILPVGKETRNPNLIYSSQSFASFLTSVEKEYDLIVIDSPPLTYGSEFVTLSKYLGGFILNIRAGICQKSSLASFSKELSFISAPMLGYVFYGVVARNQRSYYGRTNSYYYYGGSHSRYKYSYKYGYSKYGSSYGGYGYGASSSLYHEGTGSYKKIYSEELKKRKKIKYGENVPVYVYPTANRKAVEANRKRNHVSEEKVTAVMLQEVVNATKKDVKKK